MTGDQPGAPRLPVPVGPACAAPVAPLPVQAPPVQAAPAPRAAEDDRFPYTRQRSMADVIAAEERGEPPR